MFGIEAIEIYFPKTYVDQEQLEKYDGVATGKYTKGIGQLQLSFAYPFEDVNSVSLTAVSNLMRNYNIQPSQVGRLEVGTETLIDKSKSTKTVLMSLFQNNHDIEGATSINACYGGTNALINTLNWITSPSWDGRYGIVVAADLAVYEKGPARCTGGAGAVALLIGPKAKITFSQQRASFMDHKYDFYKPNPSSEYPMVDGKNSIDCYLAAVESCYKKLKLKSKGQNLLENADYFCFHSPFYKMVQKAFTKLIRIEYPNLTDSQISEKFTNHVHPTMFLPQRIGNIYTGSVFSTLISLLINNPQIHNKIVLMFSYGSGICSTMLTLRIHTNTFSKQKIQAIFCRLKSRVKISPIQFDKVMYEREKNYGKYFGKIGLQKDKLEQGSYFLTQIDYKWRRKYEVYHKDIRMEMKKISSSISVQRLQNLDNQIIKKHNKFYRLSVDDRIDLVNQKLENKINPAHLLSGGLKINIAETMTENVIGMLSLPLSVVPKFVVNKKQYMIPMCIEEPSVVAACSSIGEFISPYSFTASSTPNIMIGQVHLPNSEASEIHEILTKKSQIITVLNSMCVSMVKRGGGVTDMRVRQLGGANSKERVLDIFVDVCEAMGANIVNTICEKAKEEIIKLGITTGIAILSNYCTERKALGEFQIPVSAMSRKGIPGQQVVAKILEAYNFARNDPYRASTHNKGIMNGIDSVCMALGQDWRAVEASVHTYASRSNTYSPLTHYQLINKNGKEYFKGSLELPLAVGSIGGVISKNPLYRSTMQILGNPSSKTLSQILVCVGLAQNFAALRALAVEGIQNGHMKLHSRTLAKTVGIPDHLIDDACAYMTFMKKYDEATLLQFLNNSFQPKPKL